MGPGASSEMRPGTSSDGAEMRQGRAAAIWTAGVVMASALLGAAGQQPLPTFSVLAPGGAAIASGQLTLETKWVLFYITPGQKPCDDLVKALAGWQLPPARVIVIVRAPLPAARTYVESLLPGAVAAVDWYADPADAAWQAMNVRSTPALMGVGDGTVHWTITGVLNDPGMVEPVIRRWVGP